MLTKQSISRPCCGILRTLDISLVRTIRVPDNERTYELPPNLGIFSIYNVEDYSSKLPPSLVKKGGLFTPLYRKWQISISKSHQLTDP